MFASSPNTPATLSMSFVYLAAMALVFFLSTSPGEMKVRHVLPLQQFQLFGKQSFMADVLSGVTVGATPAAGGAEKSGTDHNEPHDAKNVGASRGLKSYDGKRAVEVEEARRFLWRQRIRALRHADYMRIETLHFLKLVASAIPRLRLVWRGEDFCAWEGVTCTALRYPLDALTRTPAVLSGRPDGGGGRVAAGGGVAAPRGGWEEDPVFTLVGVRLRGMNLFGHLPGLRPIGASRFASPLQSSVLVTALMRQRRGEAARRRRSLPITSPREAEYWPWDAADVHAQAHMQNSTYESVRHTVACILKRLEMRGVKNNHSDLQGFEPQAARVVSRGLGGGGDGDNDTSLVEKDPSDHDAGILALAQERILPGATRRDIEHTVFGEIEPRLVGIQRFDISHNPSVHITQRAEWPFPYMRHFNTAGTSVRSASGQKA